MATYSLLESLQFIKGSFQLGGGITIDNAQEWLDRGAEKVPPDGTFSDVEVIVTSWLFPEAKFDADRLRRLSERIERRHLVVDLRCTHSAECDQ
jgi:phosphoribosylformimino-5-aminoimidazole carboxamide ribotide isomerase